MYTSRVSCITLPSQAAPVLVCVCVCVCQCHDGWQQHITTVSPPCPEQIDGRKIMYLSLIKHYLSDSH